MLLAVLRVEGVALDHQGHTGVGPERTETGVRGRDEDRNPRLQGKLSNGGSVRDQQGQATAQEHEQLRTVVALQLGQLVRRSLLRGVHADAPVIPITADDLPLFGLVPRQGLIEGDLGKRRGSRLDVSHGLLLSGV
jgi:hypothetical protein